MAKLHIFSVCFLLLVLPGFARNAVSHSMVRYLPGFDGPLPFELETGYVSVDDSNGVEMFYYFVKSENNPREDPLVLWITGGPGCSSLSGFTFEIGPILVKIAEYNGSLPTLVVNPNSWTKVANIIFLDAPVGTGFTYSRTSQGFNSSDTKTAKQTNIFIRKWLIDHPEFISNPFYVGGDSYSGITNPVIVQEISEGNEAEEKPVVNLKGYLLGNPITNRVLERNLHVQYVHGMGIISDELFESAMKTCGGKFANVDPNNILCTQDVQAVSECTSGLNDVQILEPICLSEAAKPRDISRHRSSLEVNSSISSPPRNPGLQCRSDGYKLLYYWANDENVQKALHIRKGTVPEWVRCNYGIHYFRDVKSSIGYHFNISKRRYRSLIYSGDHDMLVPFLSTQAWIRSLNYPISDDWRPWLVEGQVAGYTRTYTNNMTFATVKGGGHTAPEYKPEECLAMFKRWLSYEPL